MHGQYPQQRIFQAAKRRARHLINNSNTRFGLFVVVTTILLDFHKTDGFCLVPKGPRAAANSRCSVTEGSIDGVDESSRTSASSWKRREYFASSLIPWIASSFPLPSKGASTDTSTEVCNRGDLVLEQAMPGAYEQKCMQLNQRSVPLRITRLDQNTGKATVENRDVFLQQQGIGAGNTGLAVWNSSLLLVRLLQVLQSKDPTYFYNLKSVVELGCGPGLASLALSYMGAAQVLATDGNPNVVKLARDNFQRQETPPPGEITAAELSWGVMDAIDYFETADLVIGSDLTYNAGTWRSLAEAMETVLKRNGSVLYVTLGHAGFNVNAELQGFLAVAAELGLVQVNAGDATWPFPNQTTKTLTNLIMQDCLSPQELPIVQATGGVRAVVLQKKRFIATMKGR